MCIFVLCLIVVPRPPGKNPFAVQLNTTTNTTTTTTTTTTNTIIIVWTISSQKAGRLSSSPRAALYSLENFFSVSGTHFC
jgi:hypothetical protein